MGRANRVSEAFTRFESLRGSHVKDLRSHVASPNGTRKPRERSFYAVRILARQPRKRPAVSRGFAQWDAQTARAKLLRGSNPLRGSHARRSHRHKLSARSTADVTPYARRR